MSSNNPNYSTPPAYQGAQPLQQEVPLYLPAYGISFPDAIKRFFLKYVAFSGRASRSEYWWSFLFLAIVNFVFYILSNLTHGSGVVSVLNWLWSLAIILPYLSIAFRRLHDANKSGALVFVPIGLTVLGFLIMVVGGGAAMVSGLSMNGANATAAGSALAGSIGAILFGVVIIIAAGVVMIVFMCFATNPAGARFDDVRAQPGAGPVQPAQPFAQPYPQQQAGAAMPQYPQQPVQPQYPQTPQQPVAPADPAEQYPVAPEAASQPQYPQTPQQPAQDPSQQYPNTPQQGQ